MKNLKFYAGVIALMFFAATGFAQTSAKADNIIKSSQDKFKGLSDMSASFTYTLTNPNMKKPVTKVGKAIISGDKYAITFADEQMYNDGKTTWISLPADEEVIVNCFDPEESLSLSKVFSIYENDTKSRYDGEEDGAHKITIFSGKKSNDIFKTTVWVSKTDNIIKKAQMFAKNGSVYSYDLANIRTNTGVPSSVFSFDHEKKENDGWIVTDMREDCL